MSEAAKSALWEFNIAHAPATLIHEYPASTQERILDEATTIELLEADDQQFSALILNRDAVSNGKLIVAPGAFMSDVTNPSRQWEGAQLAAAFPDRVVMLIDSQNQGLSSKHTTTQAASLLLKGNLSPSAAPMLHAVEAKTEELFAKPDDVAFDFLAISYGSRMALAMALLCDPQKVHSFIGFELPGTRKRNAPLMFYNYDRVESGSKKKLYEAAFKGHSAVESFNQFSEQVAVRGVERASSYFENAPIFSRLTVLRSPLAQDSALDDMTTLLDTTDATIRLITGDASGVGEAQIIADYIQGLNLPPEAEGRIKQNILPGEDHNLGIVYMWPRLAAHAAWLMERIESPAA